MDGWDLVDGCGGVCRAEVEQDPQARSRERSRSTGNVLCMRTGFTVGRCEVQVAKGKTGVSFSRFLFELQKVERSARYNRSLSGFLQVLGDSIMENWRVKRRDGGSDSGRAVGVNVVYRSAKVRFN